MVVKDADAAWEQYRFQSAENSIMKASLAGQIDTLAAAMNDVNNKLDRLMPVADKMMGDETALNAAAAELPPPDMGMGGGEDDMYALSEEEMGPAPEDVGSEPAEGGNMPEVEKSEEEDTEVEETEEAPEVEETAEEEFEEGTPEDESPEATDEELAAFGDSLSEDNALEGEEDLTVGGGDIDVPSVDSTGAPSEEIPMEMDMESEADVPLDETGDNPIMAAYNAFIDTLKEKAHEAIDAGQMDAVNDLADAQALMDSIWGERMVPAMDRIYKSAGVGGADAPAEKVDTVTPDNSKAKVDTPAPVLTEHGTFGDKGDAPKALDNVTKSADEPLEEVAEEDAVKKSIGNGEGEHEEDLTEYENADQGAVPNTANTGDAGSEFVDRDEFENNMYKSSGPCIPEALEIPSFRDFAKSGGNTFMESIEALKKSSGGLGTELCLKKGMGSFGGMAGIIAAQNSIQKAQTNLDEYGAGAGSKPKSEQTSMDSYARSPKTKGYEAASPEQIDADYNKALKDRTEYDREEDWIRADPERAREIMYDDEPYWDGKDPRLTEFNMSERNLEDEWAHNDEMDAISNRRDLPDLKTFEENRMYAPKKMSELNNMSPSGRKMALDTDADLIARDRDTIAARDNDWRVHRGGRPEDEDNALFPNYGSTVDEFGMVKSCDDSVEKSSEMPVEGMENIEASGNPDVPTDEVNAAFAKNGRKIATFEELMNVNIHKSNWAPRPSYASSFGGDLKRPALGENIQKSAEPHVRMGYGVDPRAVTAADWNEYKLYKSRRSS